MSGSDSAGTGTGTGGRDGSERAAAETVEEREDDGFVFMESPVPVPAEKVEENARATADGAAAEKPDVFGESKTGAKRWPVDGEKTSVPKASMAEKNMQQTPAQVHSPRDRAEQAPGISLRTLLMMIAVLAFSLCSCYIFPAEEQRLPSKASARQKMPNVPSAHQSALEGDDMEDIDFQDDGYDDYEEEEVDEEETEILTSQKTGHKIHISFCTS